MSKALTLDTGIEASKVQSLICVEEACLFEAGRASVKAVEAWRYVQCYRSARKGIAIAGL